MKYHLQGLDCAVCAQSIEDALRRNPGTDTATVSFVTGSVDLDPRHESAARKIIESIEPGVSLAPALEDRKPTGDEPDTGRRHLIRLAVAGILFAAGLAVHELLAGVVPFWLEYLLLIPSYLLVGAPVLWGAVRSLLKGRLFNELFLMSVASVGAFLIGEVPEAAGVMLFWSVGEYLQDRAVNRSRRSITGLMDLRPETARLVEEDLIQVVDPRTVPVDALVEVLPGERVPLDGVITDGESWVDTSSMTGEPVPRRVSAGDPVLAGFLNDHGRFVFRTTAVFGESQAARILRLTEKAAEAKAPTEEFITRFARIYTPVVTILALLTAVLPPLLVPGELLSDWIHRALVLLVISCPCALVVSIPLGYFGGIGGAARQGLLIKGARFLDLLTRVDTVVFDKTGTLTKGEFRVSGIFPAGGFNDVKLLSLAARAEGDSLHPVARAIREASGNPVTRPESFSEFRGLGVRTLSDGELLLAGSERFLKEQGISVAPCPAPGTVVHIAVGGVYAGCLVASDTVREEAADAVTALKRLGVRRIAMVTGDSSAAAEPVARSLGIDSVVAGCLPDGKVAALEELMSSVPKGRKTVFVGDGMNDAPVLVRADAGFAMGGLGSDAAIEAADIVVMEDRVSRIPLALRLAARTRRVVWQNILLALAVKGVFVVLGALGLSGMWEAVIADVGVALLAVLNATRTLRAVPAET